MNDNNTELEKVKFAAKEVTKRFLIDTLSRLGIIGVVFLFANFNGMIYLWFLLLLLLTY